MLEKLLPSNKELFKSTVGEAVNEWLTSEEPVVTTSKSFTITYDTDYAGDVRIHSIADETGYVLWENWNATCWTEAENKLISELLIFGDLV